jgi:septum formation protein
MTDQIILASGSSIRAQLLQNAGVPFTVEIARIDEDMIRQSLLAEDATPRDIADTLAEMKARRVASKHTEALVIGCDQILAFENQCLSKPQSKEEAIAQLTMMRGKRHQLLSAAVIYGEGKPLWRHVGVVRLHMRDASDAYIVDYVDRNWDSIRHAVGAYKLEEEGVRLFTRIEGDYFNVLGLPLLDLLSYLTLRGTLQS